MGTEEEKKDIPEDGKETPNAGTFLDGSGTDSPQHHPPLNNPSGLSVICFFNFWRTVFLEIIVEFRQLT